MVVAGRRKIANVGVYQAGECTGAVAAKRQAEKR
jgi:hypothetical protein